MVAEVLYSKPVAFWKGEIDLYERTTDKWMRRGRKIFKRYKDVRTPREDAVTRLNILWSNVQTRLPALYARDPLPEVERRFKDRDPVGRQVAEVLERALDYTVQHCNPFGRIMRQAILDWELPGRGTVWIRYVPHFHKVELEPEQMGPGHARGLRHPEGEDYDSTGIAPAGQSQTEERVEGEEITNQQEDMVEEDRLGYEETIIDYVYWEDFGHTWARVWDEVRGIWRRVYLTREELKARFTNLSDEAIEKIPLDWSPKSLNETKVRIEQKKAVVYEIWDKQERKVCWLVKNYPDLLDEKDDPLKLEGFFPVPVPLFANLLPDELIPTPNFTFYQDQAMEIDELSTRIASIGKALKVAGVRDSSAEGLDRLLAEGTENALVPVDGWIALKEKGGLAGVMELLPLKEIAEALGFLREQRQMMIDDVYQITGLSDIIRGLSEPNETATAQQIKGQFAVLRISDAQSEVQRFCRDVMRIMAEIIADYDIDTLKKISGVKLLTQAEKGALLAQLAAAQQLAAAHAPMPGMPPGNPGAGPQPVPGPPPNGGAPGPAGGGMVPQGAPAPAAQPPGNPGAPAPGPGAQSPGPDKLKLMKEPTWEEVEAVLRNPVLREFHIDIETDSTIRIDEEMERKARMEFIQAVSQMIGEAAAVPQSMIPAAGELILFGIRGFKVARNLERVFEDAIDQLKDAPPKPDPEQIKAQLEAQTAQAVANTRAQADIEIGKARAASDAQADQAKAASQAQADSAMQQMKSQHEQQLNDAKQNFESQRVQFETDAKERIANADNATKVQIEGMRHAHEKELESMKQAHEAHITGMTQTHEKEIEAHKAGAAKETETLKGQNALAVKHVEGQQAKEVTALKPAEEAKHAVKAEKDKHEPHIEALKNLTAALKEANRPRKVVRDDKGQITGIH